MIYIIKQNAHIRHINNSLITISSVCLSGCFYVAVMLNHVEEYQFALLTFLIQEHVYTFAFNAKTDIS